METTQRKSRRLATELPLDSTRLKYQQVKDYVLQQIHDGHLRSGDVLPPETILAEKFGNAVQTVRHALNELRQEGFVRRVRGKGTLIDGSRHAPRRQKLDVFALVVPMTTGALYPSLIKGFIGASAESHRQVLTCDTCCDMRIQGDTILQLVNRKVAGVALNFPTTGPMPAYQFDMLRSHGIPMVFCHRREPGLAAPLITWPWEEVGRRAAKMLLDRGHRRIAFVCSGQSVVTSGYRAGLEEVLRQAGVDLPEVCVVCNPQFRYPPSDNEVHQELVKMLQGPSRPTAVFCSDADEGERLYLEATALGMQVPRDLSILGFGCVWRDGVLSQRITAITIDERDLGRRAALLLGEMQTGERPLDSVETVLVPLGFSDGQTLSVAPTMSPQPAQ